MSDIDMDLPVEVKQPAAVKQLIWFVQGIIPARGWIQEGGLGLILGGSKGMKLKAVPENPTCHGTL